MESLLVLLFRDWAATVAVAVAVHLFLGILFMVAPRFWRSAVERGFTSGAGRAAGAASIDAQRPVSVDDSEGAASLDDYSSEDDLKGRASDNDSKGAASVDDDEPEADGSYPGVPDIFLSHSGMQKPFVENLYNALRRANHTAFFDQEVFLPKGSSFPAHIKQAACGCKLGVVVLSNDFLNSKWSMIELEMLVMKRDPTAKVLPLFYKLSPQDLKSRENLSKWRQTWKKHANQWTQAVQALYSYNGVIFIPGTSEAAYIEKVVSIIHSLVPSPLSYDLSPIKGQQRLAQLVARQFDGVARQCETVSIVGLHGIAGLGKTTMCKIMTNFYNSQYLGKSCHIEFPDDGDNSKKIVQVCKKALKTLTNLSDEHILNEVENFDEVVQLMRQNLRRYDVFLAIDNVRTFSLKEIERILKVDFSANSKILLTSRSEWVLKDLLRGHRNTYVGPLPSPDHEEALQIFQDILNQDCDVTSSVDRNQLDSFLIRFSFRGSYHALSLKALGQHVRRMCKLDGFHRLPLIFKEISNRELKDVEDLITLNYLNLPEHKRHIFLDIVAVLMEAASSLYDDVKCTYAMAHQWLSFLYKEYSVNTITNLIYELASDGLIEVRKDGHSKRMIRVNDLYSDLAHRETASSFRFLTNGSTKSVEEIEWARLERVILNNGHSKYFVEKLQQRECRNLQVLYGVNIHFQSGVNMDLLPSLCILKFDRGTLRSIKNWSAATELAIVHFYDVSGLTCLEGLEEVGGLSPALKEVCIEDCGALKKMPDLSGLTCLERLELRRNESMAVVGGLSPSLKEVCIKACGALKKMPDASGLTCLVRLELIDNEAMEEVGGENLSSTVEELTVEDCRNLRRFPSLKQCVHLAKQRFSNTAIALL